MLANADVMATIFEILLVHNSMATQESRRPSRRLLVIKVNSNPFRHDGSYTAGSVSSCILESSAYR